MCNKYLLKLKKKKWKQHFDLRSYMFHNQATKDFSAQDSKIVALFLFNMPAD